MLLLFEGASRVIEKFPAGQTIDDIKIQKTNPTSINLRGAAGARRGERERERERDSRW